MSEYTIRLIRDYGKLTRINPERLTSDAKRRAMRKLDAVRRALDAMGFSPA